jgi:hypothetical protein
VGGAALKNGNAGVGKVHLHVWKRWGIMSGRRVYVGYGNRVKTRHEYDPYRRRLKAIGSESPGGIRDGVIEGMINSKEAILNPVHGLLPAFLIEGDLDV